MARNTPILSMGVYESEHSTFQYQLRRFLGSAWAAGKADDALRERFMDRAAKEMFAVNPRARIAITRAKSELFGRQIAASPEKTYAFLTFAPAMWARSIRTAGEFDLDILRAQTAEMLDGLDFLGMIEAAPYLNAQKLPGVLSPKISWHWHAVCWGASGATLEKLMQSANRRNSALIDDRPAFHYRMHTPGGAKARIAYMNKSVLKEYRVIQQKKADTRVDKETGEIQDVLLYSFDQKKRDIRFGDAIKVAEILGSLTLYDLMIGGGEGTKLNHDAMLLAAQDIRREDAAKLRGLQKLLTGG